MKCCDEYCCNHGCNQGRDCPVRIERIRIAKEQLDEDANLVWIDWLFNAVCFVLALLGALVVVMQLRAIYG